MPCYTIKQTTVAMGKMNPAILADGLKAAGFAVSLEGTRIEFGMDTYNNTYEDGNLTGVDTSESFVNQVKRAYSQQIVRNTAKQFGWTLSGFDQKKNQFLAQKRRF